MDYKKLTEKKQKLNKHRPLNPHLIKNLDEWFKIELTYTSNAIEGNTLSRSETALVVEKGITIGGKSIVEHLEANNTAAALDFVREQIKIKPHQIKEKTVLKIHEIILGKINKENAGFYRRVPARISGSSVVLPNWSKVNSLMNEFFLWLEQETKMHAVELAAEAHYRLVTIHPFIDGNGCTARLLMNMILMIKGYPPAIIRKKDRLAYLNSLEKAQLNQGVKNSKKDYFKLIIDAVNRSLDIYLKAVNHKKTIPEEDKFLKIGELSKLVNEPNSTIRHWTKIGLLEVAEITAAGYQIYASDIVDRIKRIKLLQEKRLTLSEIKEQL